MNNIFVLNKNYKKIGTLSNQGVKPQAPYYNDLYTQELDTGADTYQFSTVSNAYTQDCIEIGNHIMFAYKNRNELFTITSIEYSHSEGYKTIGVYAEGIGFELLEVYMERPKVSNSGGSSGTDNDNDGDDNYDDEYADVDDIYIDANGNIIYDKDGSGLGDVTVDGNGNIIYKRSKNNKNNDSLEFKNISYPTFLNILLKNTGWSFVCQPGLESIKHDITIKYDTNIYAILQDSMQSYRGVELEFVFEYNNGNIKKTLKAYKDGGRGSFIGKRFEYGTNIKGITKTQKVANSKDDTVLYVDDVGIEVFYDVDFALKSAEVPEIEIGDTHYVIDTDFHPPMNIKARIGKIEVSFTDPTKNKIYLANNKKISGAVEEINEDSIKDLIDDSDNVPDHDHCDLINSIHPEERVGFYGGCFTTWSDEYDLGHMYYPWNEFYVKHIIGMGTESSGKYAGFMNIHDIRCDDLHLENAIHFPDGTIMTTAGGGSGGGGTTTFDNLHINKWLTMGSETGGGGASTLIRLTNSQGQTDIDATGISTGSVTIRDYLQVPQISSSEDIKAYRLRVYGGGLHIFSQVVFPDGTIVDSSGWRNGSPPTDPGTGDTPSNPGTGGDDLTVNHLNADTVQANTYMGGCMQLGDFIQVPELDVNDVIYTTKIVADESWSEGSPEIVVARGRYSNGSDATKITPEGITFPDGTTLTTANGAGGSTPDSGTPSSGNTFDTITVRKIQGPDPGEGQYNRVEFADGIRVDHIWSTNGNIIQMQDELVLNNGLELYGDLSVEDGNISANEIHPLKIVFPDGTYLTTANGSGSGNSSTDNITASKITIGTPTDSKASRCSLAVKGNALIEGTLYIEGSYTVNGTSYSDKSLKENIRYIDAPITHSNDNLEKADLYDFIVNQVNICEYNFIDDDRDKIGFIANEYEGTKVGDKIIFRNEETDLLGYDPNNLLFATIGALQEEIRTRDEKIASLEARLARIEAMLGINNDN